MAYDQHGRIIDYLRVSVTDRCNLRCVYCMPPDGVNWKPHAEMLTLEEIERFVRVAAREGIRRIRLTGGEPLVRRGISSLISALIAIPGIDSVAMTTNGILLPKMARELKDAGLARVNISLDTLDPAQYAHITRCGKIDEVFKGIDAALEMGFNPVKVNAVVIRSLGQDLLSFARLSVDRPLHVRFIEYMPVGESAGPNSLGWSAADTINSQELIELIETQADEAGLGALIPVSGSKPEGWGPARYYHFKGAQGTVGFINARSRHFCGECNRLRLTSEGALRACLFSDEEFELRSALRSGDEKAVHEILLEALRSKPGEHHNRIGTERHMSQIGG